MAENDAKEGTTAAPAAETRPAGNDQPQQQQRQGGGGGGGGRHGGGGGGGRGGPGGPRGPGGGGGDRGRGPRQDEGDGDGLQDRVVHIARVAKVVKGGRRFSFSALVVVGDGKEKVGFGLGKAGEVPDAIRKASDQAKKNMFKIPSVDGTIPFDVVGRYGACSVVMFPAPKGKGIIAGGAVRIITELAGVRDIVAKVHGTKNSGSVVRATIDGLMQLQTIETYATAKGTDPSTSQQKRSVKETKQGRTAAPVVKSK